MFKTLTVLKIADQNTHNLLAKLHTVITEPTTHDPAASRWSTIGYHRPEQFGASTIYRGDGGSLVFCLQLRERVLPGTVIRDRVSKVAAEYESRQGYKPGRKQLAEIKERVVDELLPRSHIKPTNILCMVTGEYLLIGSASARMVDLVIETLIGSFETGPLRFTPIDALHSAKPFLTQMLLADTTAGCIFTCGNAVTLRGEDKSTARFKDKWLLEDEIKEHVIQGMYPVELAMGYKDILTFALSERMVIKRIRINDLTLADVHSTSEDAVSEFEGTVSLLAAQFRNLLSDLTSECPMIGQQVVNPTSDEDEL